MSNQSEAIPWDQLSLSLEGSHVRMSQSQGNGLESGTAPAQDSGQSSTDSFANYDPDTSLVENVPGLFANGMGRVLGDLAASGYDAEWEVLSAADVGAPHLRKRVFITAHNRISDAGGDELRVVRERGGREHTISSSSISGNDGEEEQVADAQRERLQGRVYRRSDAGRENIEGYAGCSGTAYGQQRENWWAAEPDVGRVAHGVPKRVDRLKGLGNAVVPQCAEQIGRRIMEVTNERHRYIDADGDDRDTR